MDQATHNKIVSFIWGIADDVLRDLFVRGKYRDVILPMCVLPARRRAGADQEGRARNQGDARQGRHHRAARRALQAAGQAFYNTSKFTLRDLKSRASQQQLYADFEDYLDGFSPNVQDILDQLRVPQPAPTTLQGRRPRHADREVPRPGNQPQPESGAQRRRHGEAPGDGQPLDGHGVRGTRPQVQRGEQRRGRRALDAPRRRQADGQPRSSCPSPRPSNPARTCSTTAPAAPAACSPSPRKRSRQLAAKRGKQVSHPPLRPGDQPRDLRHLQGRHAAQGRGRERRPHRRRRRMVHALARRLPGPRVRLHALQSALRQELEEGPRSDGRQGRHARPALQGHAQGRGAVARHPLQRRPDALPGQHGSAR